MIDVADDLTFSPITHHRHGGGGTWIGGKLAGHRFEALVFPEHAVVAEFEYEDSRISKLWVQRLADRRTTFNWDRGLDCDAADDTTRAIVAFLAVGLADAVFPEG